MPQFILRRPNESDQRRTQERFDFCFNVGALEAAFLANKVSEATVKLTNGRHVHCDYVRPVGVWDKRAKTGNLWLGLSPVDILGEDRVPYDEIVTIKFRLK